MGRTAGIAGLAVPAVGGGMNGVDMGKLADGGW